MVPSVCELERRFPDMPVEGNSECIELVVADSRYSVVLQLQTWWEQTTPHNTQLEHCEKLDWLSGHCHKLTIKTLRIMCLK